MIQRERRYKDPRLNAAAEELRDRYSVGATAYDGIRVQGGARKDKLVQIAVEWADLQGEIIARTAEAEHALWEIESRLRTLRYPAAGA